MNKREIIEYIKHHIPIIIQFEDGSWCNANINLDENGTIIVKPDYKLIFNGN